MRKLRPLKAWKDEGGGWAFRCRLCGRQFWPTDRKVHRLPKLPHDAAVVHLRTHGITKSKLEI